MLLTTSTFLPFVITSPVAITLHLDFSLFIHTSLRGVFLQYFTVPSKTSPATSLYPCHRGFLLSIYFSILVPVDTFNLNDPVGVVDDRWRQRIWTSERSCTTMESCVMPRRATWQLYRWNRTIRSHKQTCRNYAISCTRHIPMVAPANGKLSPSGGVCVYEQCRCFWTELRQILVRSCAMLYIWAQCLDNQNWCELRFSMYVFSKWA